MSPFYYQLSCRDIEGVTVIGIQGFLDNSNALEFERELIQMLERRAPQMVVDIQGLEYICSSALALPRNPDLNVLTSTPSAEDPRKDRT